MPVPKAQDPVALIHELVKVLNLYTNTGVEIRVLIDILTPSLHLERSGCKRLSLSESV